MILKRMQGAATTKYFSLFHQYDYYYAQVAADENR